MPPKRRSRNGTASGAGSKAPLAALAAVAAAQRQAAAEAAATAAQQQQQLIAAASPATASASGGGPDGPDAAGIGSEDSSSAGVCVVPLTLKQQQQLERNQFLTGLTKDQLRVECRKRGQKNTGNKSELVYKRSWTADSSRLA